MECQEQMSVFAVTVTVISSLISGLFGVLIANRYYRRSAIQRRKMDTTTRFFANRYHLKGDEFSRSLNEIFVVFNDWGLRDFVWVQLGIRSCCGVCFCRVWRALRSDGKLA